MESFESLVEEIKRLYMEDLDRLEKRNETTQAQLFEHSSFKFIEMLVIKNVIDGKSRWHLKTELDKYELFTHVYFLFRCWNAHGCLDLEYHAGMNYFL